MGAIRVGPPEHVVFALRDALGARAFIETGTNNGNTAAWAAEHFEHVYTSEAATVLATAAQERFKGNAKVRVFSTTSAHMLRTLYGGVENPGPAVLWLDAHWCGEGTSRVGGECPLTDELKALPQNGRYAVIIDDARLFLRPPPPPHDPDEWPHIGTVGAGLAALGLCVYEYQDTLIGVPYTLRKALREAIK